MRKTANSIIKHSIAFLVASVITGAILQYNFDWKLLDLSFYKVIDLFTKLFVGVLFANHLSKTNNAESKRIDREIKYWDTIVAESIANCKLCFERLQNENTEELWRKTLESIVIIERLISSIEILDKSDESNEAQKQIEAMREVVNDEQKFIPGRKYSSHERKEIEEYLSRITSCANIRSAKLLGAKE